MRNRIAIWIALPICLLNIAMGIGRFVMSALNGVSFIDLFDPGAFLAISFSLVGVLIAAHRSRNPIGWIFLAIGFSQGLVSFAHAYATYALITHPGSLWAGDVMGWLGQIAWIPGLHLLLTYGLLLFPNGSLPSPRWRIVAWFCVMPLLIFVLLAVNSYQFRGREFFEHPDRYDPTGIVGVLVVFIFPLMLVCGLACVTSLVLRFRHSRGVERQQLKWVTYAAAMTLAMIVVGNYLISFNAFWNVLFLLITPSIPIAAGIAIFRYRLYDIDVIIQRTLVYGTLTGLLAAIYFGSVVLLERFISPLLGGNNQIAIVASTLAIAALFNPLRRRIQTTIDRRFYRRKYDAQKTLQAFSAKVRDETDLEQLSGDLVNIIEQSLQPAHISVWLVQPVRSSEGRG